MQINWSLVTENGIYIFFSVVDPECFIPDPDPGLNFPSSGSMFVSIFGNSKKKHLKFNQRGESINYLPFSISYYSPTVGTQGPEFKEK